MVSEWESEIGREGGREEEVICGLSDMPCGGRETGRRLSVVSQICRVEGGRQGGGGYLWSLRYAVCTSFLSVSGMTVVRGSQEEGEGGGGTKWRETDSNGRHNKAIQYNLLNFQSCL